MGGQALVDGSSLAQAELARVARVLARFLVGTQPSAASTQVAGRAVGQGLDFLDFHPYQAGDDFRRIDWRASARSREILVRRHSGELASDWQLCLDASASMGVAGAGKWLLGAQLAGALAYVLLSLGHRVGLLLFSGELDAVCPPGRGAAQYARIRARLGSHAPRPAGGRSDVGACSARLGRTQSLCVISDFLVEDAMVASLSGLLARQEQLRLFQVGAAGDLELPDAEDLLLEDVESGRTLLCGEPGAACARAGRKLEQLQDELAAWSVQYGVPLTRCSGGESWRDVLLRHFMAPGQRASTGP